MDNINTLHPNTSQDKSFNDALNWVKLNTTDIENIYINGEPVLSHINGVYKILSSLDIDVNMTQASVLFVVYANLSDIFNKKQKNEKNSSLIFTEETLEISHSVHKLLQTTQQFTTHATRLNQQDKDKIKNAKNDQATLEILRKMLLACAQDIRAVVIMLSSQLQTLRYCANSKLVPNIAWAKDVLQLYAPLANRLGVWQLKWELEDLAFRFTEPESYRQIASLLDEKRIEREQFIAIMKKNLVIEMQQANIQADISGRPKHIYSIWKKMHGKNLAFADLYDVRAFRIIVKNIKDCYVVLGIVHSLWNSIPKEFDDYISQPKPNGYKSLHTVVIADDGKAIEIQIRTDDMHRQAEFGISAHWRYKEAGSKGYSGNFSASSSYEEKISLFRQLLEWKDDSLDNTNNSENNTNLNLSLNSGLSSSSDNNPEKWSKIGNWVDDHIYVFTPQSKVIALPVGSTTLDFAYHVHTELGHRCRGARINGKMVPLYTVIENGQTVEIITVKIGAPSRNWLRNNPVYLSSNRAKSKVRAWFNALEIQETLDKGRALLDKILQREGRTGVNLEDLAHQCSYKNTHELYLSISKELINTKVIEEALSQLKLQNLSNIGNINNISSSINQINNPNYNTNGNNNALAMDAQDNYILKSRKNSDARKKKARIDLGVSIMGVDSLVIQLAKCCKPIPGDDIIGFISKGKGIVIHRTDCSYTASYSKEKPEKLIDACWNESLNSTYLSDIYIEAQDRPGLLRDISEIFSREKINVLWVQTHNVNNVACMSFTLEINQAGQMQKAFNLLNQVKNVFKVTRKLDFTR
jgi:GTP pyrophosphokinase